MHIKIGVSAISLAALFAISPALAADTGRPAVSAPNGKIAIRGGSQDSGGSVFGDFAYTMPLGHSFGLQLDGVLGYFGQTDDGVARGAAHLFWRNPDVGLLGFYGAATTVAGSEVYQFGGEGHLYFGRASLEGKIGWEDASLDDGAFGTATAAVYFTDNLRAWTGVRYSGFQDDNNIGPGQISVRGPGTVGVLGLEYQTNFLGEGRQAASLFAEGRFSDDGYRAVWGGVRIYFGESKSLIRRHREDDPGTDIPDLTEVVQSLPAPSSTSTPPPPPPSK